MIRKIGDWRIFTEAYNASYSDLEDLSTHIVKKYELTGRDASDVWNLLTSDLSDNIDAKASSISDITGVSKDEILKHFNFYNFVLTESADMNAVTLANSYVEQGDDYFDEQFGCTKQEALALPGMCSAVSIDFCDYATNRGIKGLDVVTMDLDENMWISDPTAQYGELIQHHTAIKVNGTVIDITARQFNPDAPIVFFGSEQDWNDLIDSYGAKQVKESADTFDHKTTDMKKDYDMLNTKMFGGKLRPVRLKWMINKSKVGIMTYNGTEIDYVGISTFYKMTRQQYLDVLAHEMIHVYLDQMNLNEKDHHGPRFMAMVKDLNARFPEFDIKKSENAEFYNVSKASGKTYGVLLFSHDGQYDGVIIDSKLLYDGVTLDTFGQSITRYMLNPMNVFRLYKNLTLDFYNCDLPDLAKFTVKRTLTLNSLTLFMVKPELAQMIKSGQLIKSIKLK